MTERVKLPIHIEDIESVTDCWIYNRLAIIKTSPYYKDWIASHYSLHTSNMYNFHFGDVCIYPPAYHEEILQRRPVKLFDLGKDNIVTILKEFLESGYYVIMHVKQYKEHNYFHEVLFYGFDNSKEAFMCVGLHNRIFQRMFLEYTYMENTIKEIQQHFLIDDHLGMHLALNFQYPVTVAKLNPNFKPHNCVFEAFLKLKQELNGELHEVCGLPDFADYSSASYVYRGISCLYAFKQMLEKEIKGEEFVSGFRGISSAAKKILEHRRMLYCSMDYILENWENAMTDCARTITIEYNKCNLIVEKWLNLCLKYEHTQEKDLLKRIVQEVPEIFSKEKNCLEHFINDGIDWHKFNENYV